MIVRDLTKRFGRGADQVVAVDALTFEVERGEVYGLLGPNGAGKTTTLRMILGLLKPDSGDVLIDGVSVIKSADEVKRRIGFVSASAGLYQWLTTREHLAFFADAYGLSPERSHNRAEELADLLDLREFWDRRCAVLSTGQKQRANLARSLVHDPPLMLFDEPTRGLDIVGTEVVFDFIRHLKDRHKAIVVCTHRLDESERLCDRFGLLHHGRLKHEGRLDDLLGQTGCPSLVAIFNEMLGHRPVQASSVN
ncbi:ABC transporter ATP-binding protein [Stratiformator vulcanicus]|uniref:Putative ABC transporter ATP-binding protein YbhF n=1 Tax=Stratiformator vulcanicus TaxID=2527980 RepID=A0A517R1S0_9PLAN|nr:ATP-binding cassette domain-containing protein [Stratiformator vulcanicus]QDT37794.1 putative ABC transporter ATP-binding protein YbhF [Stratiformator vulcanicus]